MLKNVELQDWAILELQEIADNNKRSLKSQMELILEMYAHSNKSKKEREALREKKSKLTQ